MLINNQGWGDGERGRGWRRALCVSANLLEKNVSSINFTKNNVLGRLFVYLFAVAYSCWPSTLGRCCVLWFRSYLGDVSTPLGKLVYEGTKQSSILFFSFCDGRIMQYRVHVLSITDIMDQWVIKCIELIELLISSPLQFSQFSILYGEMSPFAFQVRPTNG